MKLVSENPDNFLISNFEVESKEFGIKDPSFIIELLSSGFYSFPLRTFIQEIIANGRDATKEAGSERPLKIRIPTILEPTFICRDYGVGLSPQRMDDTFLNYGSSTKRDDNGQIGGFGIGGKSPLAYTDSFEIITYVDGIKRQYNIYRVTDKMTGKDKIKLDELTDLQEETDEPNGTEVIVAINPSDIKEANNSVHRATFFNDIIPEYIGVDKQGIPPQLTEEQMVKFYEYIDDVKVTRQDIFVVRKENIRDFMCVNHATKVVLLIDGVIYPVSFEMVSETKEFQQVFNTLTDKDILFVRLGNGVVKLSGSREELKKTGITMNALTAVAKDVLKLIDLYIAELFKENATLEEHIENVLAAQRVISLPENSEHRDWEDYHVSNSSGYGRTITITCPFYDAISFEVHSLSRYDSKKSKYGTTTITIDHLKGDVPVFFDDLDESNQREARRINGFIRGFKGDRILVARRGNFRKTYNRAEPVIGHDGVPTGATQNRVDTVSIPMSDMLWEKLVSDLHMKPLSSLELPAIERSYVASKREKGEFNVYHGEYSSFKTLDILEANAIAAGRIYYYTTYTNRSPDFYTKKQLIELETFLTSEGFNLEIIGVNNTQLKFVQGSEYIKPLDEFIKNYKCPTDYLDKLALEKIQDHRVSKLTKLLTEELEIKDFSVLSEIVTLREKAEKFEGMEKIPKLLADKYPKTERRDGEEINYPLYDRFCALEMGLAKKVKKCYPLLYAMREVTYISKELKKTLKDMHAQGRLK